MELTIAIIVGLFCLAAWSAWYSSKKFCYVGEYHLRSCQGREWKREFPKAKKEDIRTFLKCLIEGMDFPEKEKLKFRPNDELIEIYSSIYGGKTPFSDEMECERFILGLSEEYKMKPEELTEPWDDEHVTLGQIFQTTQAQQVASGQRR